MQIDVPFSPQLESQGKSCLRSSWPTSIINQQQQQALQAQQLAQQGQFQQAQNANEQANTEIKKRAQRRPADP